MGGIIIDTQSPFQSRVKKTLVLIGADVLIKPRKYIVY